MALYGLSSSPLLTDEEYQDALSQARKEYAQSSPYDAALKQGIYNTAGSYTNTYGSAAGVLGADQASQNAYETARGLSRTAGDYTPTGMDYTEVQGLGDVPRFIGLNAVNAVPSILPAVAGSLLVPGSGLAAKAAGAGFASYPQNYGENIGRLNEDKALAGMSEGQKALYAGAAALPQAALDALPVAGALTGTASKTLGKVIANPIARALGAVGAEAAAEGVGETGQEFLGQTMHSAANPQRDTSQDTHDLIQSGLAGAAGGLGLGGGDASHGVKTPTLDDARKALSELSGRRDAGGEDPYAATVLGQTGMPKDVAAEAIKDPSVGVEWLRKNKQDTTDAVGALLDAALTNPNLDPAKRQQYEALRGTAFSPEFGKELATERAQQRATEFVDQASEILGQASKPYEQEAKSRPEYADIDADEAASRVLAQFVPHSTQLPDGGARKLWEAIKPMYLAGKTPAQLFDIFGDKTPEIMDQVDQVYQDYSAESRSVGAIARAEAASRKNRLGVLGNILNEHLTDDNRLNLTPDEKRHYADQIDRALDNVPEDKKQAEAARAALNKAVGILTAGKSEALIDAFGKYKQVVRAEGMQDKHGRGMSVDKANEASLGQQGRAVNDAEAQQQRAEFVRDNRTEYERGLGSEDSGSDAAAKSQEYLADLHDNGEVPLGARLHAQDGAPKLYLNSGEQSRQLAADLQRLQRENPKADVRVRRLDQLSNQAQDDLLPEETKGWIYDAGNGDEAKTAALGKQEASKYHLIEITPRADNLGAPRHEFGHFTEADLSRVADDFKQDGARTWHMGPERSSFFVKLSDGVSLPGNHLDSGEKGRSGTVVLENPAGAPPGRYLRISGQKLEQLAAERGTENGRLDDERTRGAENARRNWATATSALVSSGLVDPQTGFFTAHLKDGAQGKKLSDFELRAQDFTQGYNIIGGKDSTSADHVVAKEHAPEHVQELRDLQGPRKIEQKSEREGLAGKLARLAKLHDSQWSRTPVLKPKDIEGQTEAQQGVTLRRKLAWFRSKGWEIHKDDAGKFEAWQRKPDTDGTWTAKRIDLREEILSMLPDETTRKHAEDLLNRLEALSAERMDAVVADKTVLAQRINRRIAELNDQIVALGGPDTAVDEASGAAGRGLDTQVVDDFGNLVEPGATQPLRGQNPQDTGVSQGSSAKRKDGNTKRGMDADQRGQGESTSTFSKASVAYENKQGEQVLSTPKWVAENTQGEMEEFGDETTQPEEDFNFEDTGEAKSSTVSRKDLKLTNEKGQTKADMRREIANREGDNAAIVAAKSQPEGIQRVLSMATGGSPAQIGVLRRMIEKLDKTKANQLLQAADERLQSANRSEKPGLQWLRGELMNKFEPHDLSGTEKKALAWFKRMEQENPDLPANTRKILQSGMQAVAQGDIERARRMAASLKKLLDKSNAVSTEKGAQDGQEKADAQTQVLSDEAKTEQVAQEARPETGAQSPQDEARSTQWIDRALSAKPAEVRAQLEKFSDQQLETLAGALDGYYQTHADDMTEAQSKAFNRLESMLDNMRIDREDGVTEREARSSENGERGTSSPEQRAEAEAFIKKVSKDVEVKWHESIPKHPLANGLHQLLKDGREVIRLAINALNPLSTAHHEAMHSLFTRMSASDNPAVQRAVERLKTHALSPVAARELKALYAGRKMALVQMNLDPSAITHEEGSKIYNDMVHERLAYWFQAWMMGDVRATGTNRSVLSQIVGLLRRAVGMLSDQQRVDDIMAAFSEGNMSTPEQIAAVLEQAERRQQALDRFTQAVQPALDWAKDIALPASDVLRSFKIPALNNIANLMHNEVGDTEEGLGFLPAADRARNSWTGRWYQGLENASAQEIKRAEEILTQVAVDAKQPESTGVKAVDDIVNHNLAMMRALYKYQKAADVRILRDVEQEDGTVKPTWVPLPEVEHYWPRVWNFDEIEQRKDEFVKLLLQDKYAEALDKMRVAPGLTREQMAEAIANRLVNGEQSSTAESLPGGKVDPLLSAAGLGDGAAGAHGNLKEDGERVGYTPWAQHANNRALDFIDYEDFKDFVQHDLHATASTYISQATKRAEYARRFRYDGKVIQDAVAEATKTELGRQTERFKGDKERAKEVAGKRLDHAVRNIMAMEGTLGAGINPKLRQVLGYAQVYQNLRLLPLGLVAQVIDPAGLMVRGGSLGDAWNAYKRGVSEVLAGWSGKQIRDDATRLAERLGTVETDVHSALMGEAFGGNWLTGKARKLNDKLFVVNGMRSWNRGIRIAATQAALRAIPEYLNDPTHGERHLAELGLKPEDIKVTNGRLALTESEGLTPEQARRVSQGVFRWVNEANLRPNAAHRPSLASDPHFAAFYQYKSFTYTFTKTLLKRMATELKHDNANPLLQYAAMAIPAIIGADVMKAAILNGGDLPGYMQEWGPVDFAWHGIQRAGLLGIGDMAMDAGSGEVGSILGPSMNQILKGFDGSPLSRDMFDAVPGLNLARGLRPQ